MVVSVAFFERFRQAPSEKPQGHDGLGLGLSIVKDLVTMHGGSVRAESDGSEKAPILSFFFPPHRDLSCP